MVLFFVSIIRNMLKLVTSFFIFSIIAGASAQALDAFTYIAKEGDTLSDILYAYGIKPIYGPRGELEKTIKLNPHVKVDKGNRIYPGTKITLSANPPLDTRVSETKEESTNPIVNEVVPLVIEKESRDVSNIFDQSFFWQLAPSVSWKQLSASDSNATQTSQANALSDMSYGASILYGMHFSEGFDIYSRLFVEAANFSSDNEILIVKKKMVSKALGVGFFYKKKLQVEALMGEELFLTSPNATSIEIKKVSLPQVQSTYKNEFYQFQEAALSYAVSGKLLLPRAAPGIDPKLSYGGGLGVEAKLRNQSFLLGYEQTLLKSSGNSTDSQNIFWRYTWETP